MSARPTSPRSRPQPFAALFAACAALGALGALGPAAPPLGAQYFGQNKVQYEDFDFRVLRTEHFDIYYYPREADAAALAARMAERWHARLSAVLGHRLSGRQPLILYASQAQFQQTNAIQGELGEGTGGVTEALRRRIVMPIGGTLRDLDHVLGHELVHAFQYDITGSGRRAGLGGLPAASALPLWFIEGMAEYLSLGPVAPHTAMWMRGAVADRLPSFRDLEDPRFFPYRYGHALLAYVGGRWGDAAIGRLLRSAGRRRSVDLAIREVLRMTPDTLVARWHAATRAAYEPLRAATDSAAAFGPRIVAEGKGHEGRYNVAPALSPDGARLMFLSDRELFSIDLFLADARTGEVERQVTETALDPHFQSLQFIQSAGSWDAVGRRFAFAGISGGRPVLGVYDVERRRVERELRLGGLGEAHNPTWSPDGRAIAFSGLSGGLTDLFVYDLERDSLRRLTNDRFSDLQPAWSPDGRTIAFVTDRATTRLESLAVGPYHLALYEVGTGRIRPLRAFEGVRHLNPQWAPGGGRLFFLADPGGITNVYRLDLASGGVAQLTDLYTGASGITESSPALSVAARTGRVAYSVFRSDGYAIYAIEPAALAERPAGYAAESPAGAAALPPERRAPSEVAQLLADPERGLPPAGAGFAVQPYRGGLGLTYVGQPSLVAGSSQFGTYVGGGAALYFSDVLGNHNLTTALQVNGGLKDVTALVGYQNLERRWNWGAAVQQIPYVTGGYASGTAEVEGEPAVVEQRLLVRQTNRDVLAALSYPFSRVQRVDFAAGYTNISFDRELRTQAFSLRSGVQLVDREEDLDAPDDLNLGVGSAALVYDNAFQGATSPILGQRYRVEGTATLGSVQYFGALADYRRYFLPVRPFTVAARLLHYGRYGQDAEDPRLRPLFLGYPGLVRGYAYGSFDASECVAPPGGDPEACPVFDQLLGSRIAVASLELRFPLLGVLGLGSGYYGGFPLELALFGDAGLAWDSDNEPSLTGGDREPVYSAGAGLRANLFGFAVAELDLVRPFDRPGKGWIWQFSLQPGF